MYLSNIAVTIFGITVLFRMSYQHIIEYEPIPKPRDPPNQSKHYTDRKIETIEIKDKWACAQGKVLYMRWPDRLHRPNQSDLWFDRLVYIHHEGRYDYIIRHYTEYMPKYRKLNKAVSELSITLNGVIFDDDRVLTSYNPWRQIIKYAFKRHFTHVCILDQRKIPDITDDSATRFITTIHDIACARQVVPLEETKGMPQNLWHGRANKGDFIRQHSPIHDLMVIRTNGFIKGMTKKNYEFSFITGKDYFTIHGPQKSYLAKKNDVIGSEFKFCMMGHIFGPRRTTEQIKVIRDTYVGYYNKSDNVLTDCDEWIPREWGWFICVLNKKGLRRLASGAVLYSRGLVFGIGSFTLFKGDKSIIVFTDVRPYESIITNSETGTCTTTDQFGKKKATRSPDEPPTNAFDKNTTNKNGN